MNNATKRTFSLLVGGLALLVQACAPPQASITTGFRVPVEVLEVETATIEATIITSGELRTREAAPVKNEVPGTIYIGTDSDGNRLREGSKVSAGDVIAQITGEDARIHSRIEQASQALRTALAELKRAEDLFTNNLVSESELFSKRSSYESARLEADRAKLNAAKAKLVAPINGTILELAKNQSGVPVADGSLVSQGLEVALIGPIDPLVAVINLVGPELARIREGQLARVRYFAFDGYFEGTVSHLAPTVNRESHTFRAEVLTQNPGERLRPGMYVEVVIVTQRHEDVPVIPREALANREGKPVAFVLDGQKAERRELKTGLRDDDKVEVTSGLDIGERVIVRGLETLTHGASVRVVGS